MIIESQTQHPTLSMRITNPQVIVGGTYPHFNFDYQDWSTDEGTDRVFFADGTIAKTQLNEVNWSSYALSLGLSLRF